MTQRLLHLLCCVLFLLSCKKDSNSNQNNSSTPAAIAYTDFTPDIVVNSISSYGPDGGCSSVALPVNAVVLDSIKVNLSGPFVFEARNFYSFQTASNPCYNYHNQLSVYTRYASDSFAVVSTCGTPLLMDSGDVVNASTRYSNWGVLIDGVGGGCLGPQLSGPAYLGIKRTVGSQVFYGWIHIDRIGNNGVIIKDCALNLGSGKAIACGRTH